MDGSEAVIRLEPVEPEDALDREWLCTNGLGSYAMGTVAGANTRRYHGVLVAALKPPLGRTLLCARVDETFDAGDGPVDLGAAEFHDGARHPWGVARLSSFRLEGARPVWEYHVPGGVLEKAIWMEHGLPTTYLRYLARGTGGRLRIAFFATHRDYHHETHGSPEWQMAVHRIGSGIEVTAFPGAVPWRVVVPRGARFTPVGQWWWRFLHRRERERGLDCEEDLYLLGHLTLPLSPGEPAIVAITSEKEAEAAGALRRQQARERQLTELAGAEEHPLRARLALAADQFLVRRGSGAAAGTALAGYPWFCDWGRDTMISIPGLTLATGRHAEARQILTTYARYLDRGMLPNRFPDTGESPEYNTVDATLWFFQAIAAYVGATGDASLLEELFPALDEVIAWHLCGTRYGIGVDPDDGLLHAGQDGMQLTWMDAKVDDWCFTPRQGKPVEINALWINALRHMDAWARRLRRAARPRGVYFTTYADLAARATQSFNARFWSGTRGYLYDVVDGPAGHPDPRLRPNQLFAISLPYPALGRDRWQRVVSQVEHYLLTPVGLRTLAPWEPGYQRHYHGDRWCRDGAYHQGTVWPWLLGAYVDARRRAGTTEEHVQTVCRPLVAHLARAGIGSVSEVFDGDFPHAPGGCPAQAWSVAELLRVLTPPRRP
ncbi:MAG: glycogen debranching enzyme family protein [Armatimonadetes bacterium]|nr:glycogen debranching enzyme family protein [Armatimonadota bacterium]